MLSTESEYSIAHHAALVDEPGLAWAAVARWDFSDHAEWFLEVWDDDFNEAREEAPCASEAAAMAHAQQEFGALDWQPGPPPPPRG